MVRVFIFLYRNKQVAGSIVLELLLSPSSTNVFMVKNILAVLAGLAVGLLVMQGMEGFVSKIYPMPASLDMH